MTTSAVLRWEIHEDGTFDVVGNTMSIRGSYPGCDSHSVRPVSVQVERREGGGTLSYDLQWGRLVVTLTQEDSHLVARCKVSDCEQLPGQLNIFADALVQGAAKFYRLGQGIIDKAGFYTLPPAQPYNAFGI